MLQLTKSFLRGSNVVSIKTFLIVSTGFLYLVAAGLFSKGVWHLEANDVSSKILSSIFSETNQNITG